MEVKWFVYISCIFLLQLMEFFFNYIRVVFLLLCKIIFFLIEVDCDWLCLVYYVGIFCW